MPDLLGWRLKNFVVHKDVEFRFDHPGVYVVRGANWSGKSVLFNAIRIQLKAAPPIAAKKVSAKHFHRKGSEISSRWKLSKKRKLNVVQFGKGESVKYKVELDGKDLKARTVPIAKRLIDRYMPFSEAYYDTMVHLSAFRPHVLQLGKDNERLRFFEELFDANVYDAIREVIKGDLDEARAARSEIETLENEVAEHERGRLPEDVERKIIKRIKKLEARIKEIDRQSEKINSEVGQLTQYTLILKGLPEDRRKNLPSYRDAKQQVQTIEEGLQLRRREYRKALRAEGEEQAASEIRIKREKIEAQLATMPEVHKVAHIDNILDPMRDEYNKMQTWFNELRDAKSEIKAASRRWKKLPDKLRYLEVPAAKRRIAQAEAEVEKLEKLRTRLEKLIKREMGECPTCGSELNLSDLQKLLETSQQNLGKQRMFAKHRQEYEEITDLFERYGKPSEIKRKWNSMKPRFILLGSTIEYWEREREKSKRHRKLTQKLKDLPKVSKITKVKTPSGKLLKVITEQEELLGAAIRVKDAVRLFKEHDLKLDLEYGVATKRLNKLKGRQNSVTQTLNEFYDKVNQLRAKLSSSKDANQHIERIEGKASTLRKQAKMLPIFEEIYKAYGPNGLRIEEIAKLVRMYVRNLNRYAPLFPGKIKYSCAVDNKTCRILADREGGLSDVYYLSGAQARMFQLTSVLALLPFMPKSRRMNYIVLDEMDDGMDESVELSFKKDFLPKLASLIPHVVLVTPKTRGQFSVEGAREYLIDSKAHKLRCLTDERKAA